MIIISTWIYTARKYVHWRETPKMVAVTTRNLGSIIRYTPRVTGKTTQADTPQVHCQNHAGWYATDIEAKLCRLVRHGYTGKSHAGWYAMRQNYAGWSEVKLKPRQLSLIHILIISPPSHPTSTPSPNVLIKEICKGVKEPKAWWL